MAQATFEVRESPSGPVRTLVVPDLPPGSVTTAMIQDGAVTTPKLGAGAVTNAKLGDESVSSGKLQSGSVTPDKTQAGTFAESASYPKETDGVQTVLAPQTHDRVVLISITTTETFANNAGAAPTFVIGETDDPTKFGNVGAPSADPVAFMFSGILLANKALIVTATAATVDGEGAIRVDAHALRK